MNGTNMGVSTASGKSAGRQEKFNASITHIVSALDELQHLIDTVSLESLEAPSREERIRSGLAILGRAKVGFATVIKCLYDAHCDIRKCRTESAEFLIKSRVLPAPGEDHWPAMYREKAVERESAEAQLIAEHQSYNSGSAGLIERLQAVEAQFIVWRKIGE